MIRIHQGDALEVLRGLESASAHALVTDPPAGIGFMDAAWDSDRGGREKWIAWLAEVLREARRVLRPGAHALVWALPRTAHWTATALEDAGFEIRDVVVHLFGTGFPKSLDVSKAIDKAAGAERQVVGRGKGRTGASAQPNGGSTFSDDGYQWPGEFDVTAPATDAAREWRGWGTALKPAAEHWILARAPLAARSVAGNVLEHGTGALNIDACRIGDTVESWPATRSPMMRRISGEEKGETERTGPPPAGRWPANVCFSQGAAELLDAQSGISRDGVAVQRNRDGGVHNSVYGPVRRHPAPDVTYGGEGGASRFFYCPKASSAERGAGNAHPTVKPLELMRWLVRLVTPPGGTVLDPFAGSGTTVLAALAEGCFDCVAIERDGDYASTALRRAQQIDPLFHGVPVRAAEGA